MSELEPLDPLSHELLDAARGEYTPPPGSRDRVRRRVVSRVGAAAFMGTTIAAALWIKITAGIVAVLVIAGAAYFVLRRPPARVACVAPLVIVSASTPEVTAIAPPPVVSASAPPSETTEVVPAPRPPPVTSHAASRPPAPPTIGEETALLLAAETAIREGDAAHAMSLLDEHARRFPSGTLAEEREATRVLALCAAGRAADARAASTRFLAAHPRSPAAARVRSSCAGN